MFRLTSDIFRTLVKIYGRLSRNVYNVFKQALVIRSFHICFVSWQTKRSPQVSSVCNVIVRWHLQIYRPAVIVQSCTTFWYFYVAMWPFTCFSDQPDQLLFPVKSFIIFSPSICNHMEVCFLLCKRHILNEYLDELLSLRGWNLNHKTYLYTM